MTLPSKDSLETYGGAMSNYSDPVDPTTDEDAAWRNKYAANVAMMTHTVTRGARSFLGTTGGATGIADPSSGFVHDAVWGDSAGVKIVASYVQTGVYELTAPATVSDELGTTHTLNIRRAWGNVDSSDGTLRIANAKPSAAQRMTVYTYQANASGQLLPSQLVGEVITVFFV
jgi:hypothetical protein